MDNTLNDQDLLQTLIYKTLSTMKSNVTFTSLDSNLNPRRIETTYLLELLNDNLLIRLTRTNSSLFRIRKNKDYLFNRLLNSDNDIMISRLLNLFEEDFWNRDLESLMIKKIILDNNMDLLLTYCKHKSKLYDSKSSKKTFRMDLDNLSITDSEKESLEAIFLLNSF